MNEKKHISYSFLDNINVLGFWIYLMSDCIIFSVLFIVHIIMSRHGYSNFLRMHNLFSPFIIFLETFVLLLCSLLCNLIKHFSKKLSTMYVLLFLFLNLFLGSIFVGLEFVECLNIFNRGYYPGINGYFSSFYVLLGMHAVHVLFGLIWTLILIFQVFLFNFTVSINISLVCFSLFWHFLDIIWIILIICVYFQ